MNKFPAQKMALEFIADCIHASVADGHQQFETSEWFNHEPFVELFGEDFIKVKISNRIVTLTVSDVSCPIK